MATYAFDNAAQNFTAGTVASGATTVTLTSTSLFDASGKQYIVRADDSATTAYMYALVTANNTATNVLTWTEGVDGTSAIALGAASTITEVITKKTINDTMVRLDTGVSQTLTGPLVVPITAAGSTVSTSYGSMPIKIATTTLSGTQSSVVFSGIPAAFQAIEIIGTAITDQASIQALEMRINADTGNNYNYSIALVNSASSTSMTVQSGSGVSFVRIGDLGTVSGSFKVTFPDYASTAHQKAFTTESSAVSGGAPTWQTFHGGGSYSGTQSASTITILAGSGNLASGSVISIYGIP